MLSEEQKRFFAHNGYLALSRAISPGLCSYLRDLTWMRLPPAWNREDPASWTGEVADSCHAATLAVRRGHLKFQRGGLADDDSIRLGFCAGSGLAAAITSLIGCGLEPVHVRGLYSIIPTPEWPSFREAIAPHVEAHPMQVVAVGYLDDVHRGEGGIHVWPGSHRELYPTFLNCLDYTATEATKRLVKIYSRLEPLEITGSEGDVVLMHHRLFHAPSINRSASRIRYAIFCDYMRADWREHASSPPGDIWNLWPALAHLAPEPPDFQHVERNFSATVRPRDELSESSRRKSDASKIARLRQDGDYWVAVSDSPTIRGSKKLFPSGSDLSSSGIEVWVNGNRIQSASEHDIIAPVEIRPGPIEIEVRNVGSSLGLRVVTTRIPLTDSMVVLYRRLSPRSREHRVAFNLQPQPALS